MTPAERDALEALAANEEAWARSAQANEDRSDYELWARHQVRAAERLRFAFEIRALLARSEPPTPTRQCVCAKGHDGPHLFAATDMPAARGGDVSTVVARCEETQPTTPESAREVHLGSHGLNTPPAKGVSEELTKQAGPADAAGRVTPRSGVTPGFAVGGTVPGTGSPSESARESEPPCEACGHTPGRDVVELPIVAGALSAQADAERRLARALNCSHFTLQTLIADVRRESPPAITEAVRAEVVAVLSHAHASAGVRVYELIMQALALLERSA